MMFTAEQSGMKRFGVKVILLGGWIFKTLKAECRPTHRARQRHRAASGIGKCFCCRLCSGCFSFSFWGAVVHAWPAWIQLLLPVAVAVMASITFGKGSGKHPGFLTWQKRLPL